MEKYGKIFFGLEKNGKIFFGLESVRVSNFEMKFPN